MATSLDDLYEDRVAPTDPRRPTIARSGDLVGVALPERGMQDGAMLTPDAALSLGLELVHLALTLEAHEEAVRAKVLEVLTPAGDPPATTRTED